MKANTRRIIFISIYVLFIAGILFFLNRKRSQEYSYTADFQYYTLDAGMLTDPGKGIYIDETSEHSGVFAHAPGMQFRTGEYDITINYHASADGNKIHLSSNANYEAYADLPASGESVTVHTIVYPSSDSFHMWLIYGGQGSLLVNSIVVTSAIPLYTDYEYYMILTVLAGILIPLIIWYLAKKKGYKREDWIETGILSVLAVIVNYPVFLGYIWFGIDMRPHLMRIDGVSTCIEARRIPTILYSNYCNGYGELSCIYPDKFLYLPGLLRNRGVSLISSYNTMHVIINVAALLIMYKCVKYITQSRIPSFVAAVVFCFIPFRMTVMGYYSQALGTGIAMLFLPILFTGLYDVFFLKGRRWYLIAIGMAGAVCSHILSAVLAVVMCVVTAAYCGIVLFVKKRKADPEYVEGSFARVFKQLVIAVGTFLVLCLSTIVPFVYYYRLGLNMGKMSLDFLQTLHTFEDDILGPNGIFHMLAFVVVVAVIVILCKAKTSFKDLYGLYCAYLLVAGFGLFFIGTCVFPWRWFANIGIIYKALCFLQFSYRFMIPSVVALSMGMGMLTMLFLEKIKITNLVVFAASLGFFITVLLGCVETYYIVDHCDPLILDRMSGEFYYRQLGYLPSGTEIEFYSSSVPNIGDWDSVENIEYTKVGVDIHYVYRCSSDGNYIELPLFYYKGYHAFDVAGAERPITISATNRITVPLVNSQDVQTLNVVFKVNPLFYICSMISALGTAVLYMYIWRSIRKDG